MGISAKTMLLGVMGWPIEHSVSPAMHNAAFQALGIDGCYLAFAVHPSWLREAILGIRALGLRGINVTVPHKQAALLLMDQLTPEAASIGAVNTVIVKPSPPLPQTPWERGSEGSSFSSPLSHATQGTESEAGAPRSSEGEDSPLSHVWHGRGAAGEGNNLPSPFSHVPYGRGAGGEGEAHAPILLGHNTDAGGFLAALRDAGFEPRGCRALVLGAGGAARAVVYALANVGASVVILNRHVERASALAEEFAALFPQARLSAEAWGPEALSRAAPGAELVVNATSLGMAPAVEGSPWPDEVPFPAGSLLFDLVYNPRETRFMRQALAAGGRALDGLRMLVYQGAEAFELWTGQRPPISVMLAACLDVLGGS